MDYMIQPSLVRRVFPRSGGDLTAVSHESEVLTRIVELLGSTGCSIHLFGSRRLNLHHPASDWDILVVGFPQAADIVENVIHHINGSARRFTTEECLDRASRYARPTGPFGFDCLASLFQKTTMYLKTQFGELGIFFAGPTEIPVPDPEFLHVIDETLIGTILRNDGRSHHLPRLIRLRLDDSSEAFVSTVLWELGGLEELAGTRVRLRGLRPIGDGHWWMGGLASDLDFLTTS